MNPILKNLLDRAEKWQDGNPSPLLMRNIHVTSGTVLDVIYSLTQIQLYVSMA